MQDALSSLGRCVDRSSHKSAKDHDRSRIEGKFMPRLVDGGDDCPISRLPLASRDVVYYPLLLL